MVDLKKHDKETLKSAGEIISFIVRNEYEMGFNNFVDQIDHWQLVYGYKITPSTRSFFKEFLFDWKIKKMYKGHYYYIFNKKRLSIYLRRIKLILLYDR